MQRQVELWPGCPRGTVARSSSFGRLRLRFGGDLIHSSRQQPFRVFRSHRHVSCVEGGGRVSGPECLFSAGTANNATAISGSPSSCQALICFSTSRNSISVETWSRDRPPSSATYACST